MWHGVRSDCGHHRFFRRELAGGDRLRQEVFYLAYHLHWSWRDILALEIEERRVYVQLLAARIEAENRELESNGRA